MGRASALFSSDVPRRLGTLTATERRLWRAFPQGEAVDLRVGDPALDDPAQADRWPAERSVRGEVLAALLLGACPAAPGAVAVVRLTGARITGGLRLTHGQVASPFILQGCRFDGTIDLDGAVTESIDLSGSRLIMLSAYGTLVRGTLDLNDTVVTGGEQAVNADGIRIEGNLSAERATVTGSFSLINAQISGRAKFIDAKLSSTAPDGEALNAGGMRLGRSLLAQGLETRGELRMPGAHIGSSLHLNGAVLDGLGGTALHADSLTVASEAVFRSRGTGEDEQPFTALGTVRVPGAKFGNGLDLRGARLTPKEDRPALRAARIVVEGNLLLGGGLRTDGELRLTGARITGHLDLVGMASPNALLSLHAATAEGGIRDDAASWPNRLNLDGLSYGPFSDYLDAHQRLLLISRQIRRSDGTIGGFRAQPYEQLAGYYRSLGSDGEARTVLLAKQRALRAQLPWWQRISGRLLDLLVGYGYRPLRAIGWAIALLVAGSVYFAQVRPQRVSSEDTSVFNPVLYTADHLIPVIHFGQSDVWQYHGAPAVVTVVLTILGWTLGIAIAGTAGRTFTRN